jgi:hypothetical protein
MRMIGFLGGASRSTYGENIAAIHQGLMEMGYVEGQNLAVEHRWAEGQYDRLPAPPPIWSAGGSTWRHFPHRMLPTRGSAESYLRRQRLRRQR